MPLCTLTLPSDCLFIFSAFLLSQWECGQFLKVPNLFQPFPVCDIIVSAPKTQWSMSSLQLGWHTSHKTKVCGCLQDSQVAAMTCQDQDVLLDGLFETWIYFTVNFKVTWYVSTSIQPDQKSHVYSTEPDHFHLLYLLLSEDLKIESFKHNHLPKRAQMLHGMWHSLTRTEK